MDRKPYTHDDLHRRLWKSWRFRFWWYVLMPWYWFTELKIKWHIRQRTRPGRVRVWSGDGKEYLGEGDLLGTTTTYFWRCSDGIMSLPQAEEKPPDDIIQSQKEWGFDLIKETGNPKIRLDDGRIVYGCQVWWDRAEAGTDR